MNIEQAKEALTQLFIGGAFRFPEDLVTITEYEYADLINKLTPENYTLAYQAFADTDHSLNVLENCYVDRDEQGMVELIRKERTYVHRGFRVFQLQIDTVPKLIITGDKPDKANKLITTWWLNSQGATVHYRVIFNGDIQQDTGIFKE